jgi:hypothetical protein
MTKDDIIKLAREAGFADGVAEIAGLEGFANFANLVAKHERKACARLCEERGMVKGGEVFAARIRARGNT